MKRQRNSSRSAALSAINALRLDGIWSIIESITALAHDIKGLLRLLG